MQFFSFYDLWFTSLLQFLFYNVGGSRPRILYNDMRDF
uniref:Uncharacterized protein n=1 Tax=Podoviridae sp. ctaNW81 TaxID=2826562 RepID=A0A8S5M5L6_9CAUD|nr:MAG TPA: hypothetical protein [Podoviridae sp. ctaNW81]